MMQVLSLEADTANLACVAEWPKATLVMAARWLERVRTGTFDGLEEESNVVELEKERRPGNDQTWTFESKEPDSRNCEPVSMTTLMTA